MVAGIGFAVKGIYDIYNCIENWDFSNTSSAVENITFGVSLASNASA